jgi:hypothetical protein
MAVREELEIYLLQRGFKWNDFEVLVDSNTSLIVYFKVPTWRTPIRYIRINYYRYYAIKRFLTKIFR